MAYFIITIKENAAKRRRKITAEANTPEKAKTVLEQQCMGTGFSIKEGSFKEISKSDHNKIFAVRLGRVLTAASHPKFEWVFFKAANRISDNNSPLTNEREFNYPRINGLSKRGY